jgi:NADH-quinone oxidoreductase subunit N
MNFDPNDLNLLAPELFLLGAICVILIADLFIPPERRGLTHFLAILSLIGCAVLTLRLPGAASAAPRQMAFANMFVRDGIGDVLKLFIYLSTALVFVYARPYLAARRLWNGEFYVLCLFAVLGMMLLVSAANLVMVYLGLELLALASYALVALDRDSGLASEAAMKYFVLGALASGMLLYGMSLVYGGAHSLDLATIQGRIAGGYEHAWFAFGLVFIVVGIGFKFGAVPFHMWVPDVYQGSNTGVTLFVSTAPKIAAFGMAYRLLDGAFPGLVVEWRELLAVLAVLSLVLGNLIAIAQSNLKRMLAYSTISHVGFLFLGLINGGIEGYSAAMFYAVTYALTTAVAFGSIVLLSRAGFEAEEINDFAGLNQRNGWYAFVVLLTMASLAGIPVMVGFFAKLAVLKAALDAGYLWLVIVGGVFAVIGSFYYLRVIKVMYFDEPASAEPLALPSDMPFRIVLSANGLALLALGLYSAPLMNLCQRVLGG